MNFQLSPRSRSNLTLVVLSLFLILPEEVPAAGGADAPVLFLEPASAALAQVRPAPASASRSRVVQLNTNMLRPSGRPLQKTGSRVIANLFAGEEYTVVIDHTDVHGDDAFSCIGHVESIPGSVVVLSTVGGVMAGSVQIPWEEPFQVEYIGDNLHRVNQLSAPAGDWCATGMLPVQFEAWTNELESTAPDPLASSTSNVTVTNPPTMIDFLVVYTARALAGAGGAAGINALMEYAVTMNNLCYANSGITARWNIVGRSQVNYTESGDIGTDLNWLAVDSTVANLKRLHRADIVLMIVEFDAFGWRGIAASTGDGHGYSVFLRPGISGDQLLVPHEVGHLLGGGHDRHTCAYRAARGGCGAYNPAYSYGHRFEADGLTYTTVMSYDPGIWIPYFSNPNVKFRGVATGIAQGATNAADNARTINLRAPVVARAQSATNRYAFTFNTIKVSETNAFAELEVHRTGDLSVTGKVECITVGATAALNEDFGSPERVVAFAQGEEYKVVKIPMLNDEVPEGDETLTVTLCCVSTGAALDDVRSVTVTIEDDEPWIAFSKPSLSWTEGVGTAAVALVRGGATNGSASASLAAEPGTATAGSDFTVAEGTVTFVPGEIEKLIQLEVKQDVLTEPDEGFALKLSGPGAAQHGSATLNVRILDDDRPGSLDPTWLSPAGLILPDQIAVGPDGAVLLAGNFSDVRGIVSLRRYRPDGSLDPTFSPAEFKTAVDVQAGMEAEISSFVVDSAGRIVVGGVFGWVNGTPHANLVRLLPNGTVDETFTAWANGSTWICPYPDGRLLVHGSFFTINGASYPYLARLSADGELDTTFKPKPNSDTIRVSECALQGNGKILVAGNFWGFEGLTREYFARLNSDGSVDRAFQARPDGSVKKIVVLPDQRIVIGGGFTNPRRSVAILLPDGSRDQSFNPRSLVNGVVYHVVPLADGRMMISGLLTVTGPTRQNYLARLNPDGSLDTTFDSGLGPNDTPTITRSGGLLLEPSGAVLLSGAFTQVNDLPVPHLARLRSDGTRPVLGRAPAVADGHVSLDLVGNAGASYDIEASADLRNWTVVGTEKLTGTTLHWTDPNPAGAAIYYRARQRSQ